jgi:hypothetical protein
LTLHEDRGGIHLADEEVAGYVDGRLTESDREQIEEHLAICAECRNEVRVAAQLVRFSNRRKLWYRGSWALAAAAILTLLIADPLDLREPGAPAYRGPDEPVDVDDRVVTVVVPEDGASLEKNRLLFVWHRVEEGARFRFTLTDLLGEVVWSAETTDTLLSLPDDLTLEPGMRYVWYVDVLLLDGRSITTGTRRFELVP